MDVTGQLHAQAALLAGKQFPVPPELEAGWDPEPVTFQRRDNFLLLLGFEPLTIHLAEHYYLRKQNCMSFCLYEFYPEDGGITFLPIVATYLSNLHGVTPQKASTTRVNRIT
jgi:hypothetical protein